MLFHWRGFQDRDIVVNETPIVVGRIDDVHRDVTAELAIVELAFEPGKIPREISGVARIGIRLEHRARLERERAANFDVSELQDARGERLIENVRLSNAKAVVDPASRLDYRRGLVSADRLAFQVRFK